MTFRRKRPVASLVGKVLGLLALAAATWGAAEGPPATPEGIDGTWDVGLTKPFGLTLHTFLILREKGNRVEGTVFPNNAAEIPIRDGRRDGLDAVFSINWGWTFRVRRAGDTLRVLVTYDQGGRQLASALPVSASVLREPDPLPVPPLETLPDNGLARTPPMGWNSWNHFAEGVDDKTVRETADAMVASGMAEAGYRYINIDDTWELGRDPQGNLVPNRKFPDMKALADYVHRRGLKLGIYSSPGPLTCGGYMGSFGHEEQDAKTFAEWGIDYLKYDWCSAGRIYRNSDLRPVYQKMGAALQRSGRPIVFSLCEYGSGEVWKWGRAVGGNLWRTTGDIQDNWRSMAQIGFDQGKWAPYAGPGHWNDPDMLEVGNGGMTAEEYRTHFSLWCLLAAPLMAGNDIAHMSAETRAILTNREVIAVDQDPLGREATPIGETNGVEVWARPLTGGQTAIGIFNRTTQERTTAFSWSELGRSSPPNQVRDLWKHLPLPPQTGGVSLTISAHGVVMLILR